MPDPYQKPVVRPMRKIEPIEPLGLSEWQKKAQSIQERSLFNRNGAAVSPAEAAKNKLDELVGGISARMQPMTPLFARVKERERAQEKVLEQESGEQVGDWLRLKDYARTTLVLPDRDRWDVLLTRIRGIFSAQMGFQLTKDKAVNNDPCGYTGHNFVMRFGSQEVDVEGLLDHIFLGKRLPAMRSQRPGHEAPVLYAGRFGEIQVNTVPVMYAKMDKASFIRNFGDETYAAFRARTGVEGGAGHILYEIYRDKVGTPRSNEARKLSQEYYARTAGQTFPPAERADQLAIKVAIILTRTSAKLGSGEMPQLPAFDPELRAP